MREAISASLAPVAHGFEERLRPLKPNYPGHMIELVLVNGERRTLIPRDDAEESHQLTQLMERAGFFRHGWVDVEHEDPYSGFVNLDHVAEIIVSP